MAPQAAIRKYFDHSNRGAASHLKILQGEFTDILKCWNHLGVFTSSCKTQSSSIKRDLPLPALRVTVSA